MVSRRHLFYLVASVLVLSLLLVACERPIPGGDGEATATPDVDAGGGVTDDTPVVTPVPDTGDEGTTDEGTTDEGTTDEGTTDEGTTDEGTTDEGTTDEGTTDEGTTDEGTTDEGMTDEGTADESTAGDTGGTEQTVTVIPATHTVAAGENLYRIGLKYGLSWRDIARFNRINPHRIYVGQVLRLPGGDTGGGSSTAAIYVVRRGDNLFRIGLRYGVSWMEIAQANGLSNPNQIYVGQTLKIPVSTPGPNPSFSHLVRPGQTLFRISRQYGVPWSSIAQENKIEPPYTIYVGQTLVIPGS